jgi:hypothetical protein
MFKEGNQECINSLLKPSRSVLDAGVPIKSEPFERRQALWKEIKANSERYKNGECGTFLKDLHGVFLARFDASLLLLAHVFRMNGEQFEGSEYFSAREIEAYETIERFGYFRILSRNEIAKKIRSRDEKTLALIREYAVSMKKHMDEILSDEGVRDTIRSYVKRQWDENSKKIGDAVASADVDLDFFASLPAPKDDADRPPQTIIINAGNDAAINLGSGSLVKDSVLTKSSIESGGNGKTTIADSVVTGSSIKSEGPAQASGSVSINDSVVTGSTIQNVQSAPEKPAVKEEKPAPQNICPSCNSTVRPEAKFCPSCGARIPVVCSRCNAPLSPQAKFCPNCGQKTP